MGQLMKHMKAMKAMRAMKGMKLTRQLAYTMARQARLTKPQLGIMAPQVPTREPMGQDKPILTKQKLNWRGSFSSLQANCCM